MIDPCWLMRPMNVGGVSHSSGLDPSADDPKAEWSTDDLQQTVPDGSMVGSTAQRSILRDTTVPAAATAFVSGWTAPDPECSLLPSGSAADPGNIGSRLVRVPARSQ